MIDMSMKNQRQVKYYVDQNLRNAGMPTYSEIRDTLAQMFSVFEYYNEPEKIEAAKNAYRVLMMSATDKN